MRYVRRTLGLRTGSIALFVAALAAMGVSAAVAELSSTAFVLSATIAAATAGAWVAYALVEGLTIVEHSWQSWMRRLEERRRLQQAAEHAAAGRPARQREYRPA